MKTFHYSTVNARNGGGRREISVPIDDDTAIEPRKRADFISARMRSADSMGLRVVNWRIE